MAEAVRMDGIHVAIGGDQVIAAPAADFKAGRPGYMVTVPAPIVDVAIGPDEWDGVTARLGTEPRVCLLRIRRVSEPAPAYLPSPGEYGGGNDEL